MIRALCLALVLLSGAIPAPAQQFGGAPVLTLDQEALFRGSQFGQRLQAEIATASGDLGTENREIETRLVAEEQALTEQRATVTVDEFRELAADFDEKVTGIRAAQDEKARAITRRSEEAQQVFFARVGEVLGQIMDEKGAVAILDERAVFLSSEAIDITDLAIARIDAVFGDGQNTTP